MGELDNLDRRTFLKTVGISAAGVATFGLSFGDKANGNNSLKKSINNLKIGHTGITWGFTPQSPVAAMTDISALGFKYFEPFGAHALKFEQEGTLSGLLDKYKLKLSSFYCPTDFVNSAKMDKSIEDLTAWASLLKKYGGKAIALGPPKRIIGYVFSEHKDKIINNLNELGKRISDIGISMCVHQHTGTVIETAEEVYAVMEKVNTNVVKFGPDIGQLRKGGADPVKIVSDFISIIEHVHLKDYSGNDDNGFLGYCPLGQGLVKLEAILEILLKNKYSNYVMIELDRTDKAKITATEAATINKQYLSKLGYKFET